MNPYYLVMIRIVPYFECVRQIIMSLQGEPYNNNYDNDETDDMSECHPVDLQQPYFCDFHLF